MMQPLFKYQSANWAQIKQSYLALAGLTHGMGEKVKNIGVILSDIVKEFARLDVALASVEKVCLSLLDLDLVRTVVELVKNKKVSEVLPLLVPLEEQLRILAAGAGVGGGLYRPDETINYLKNPNQTADLVSVVRTIYDSRFGEKESRDINLAILEFLKIKKDSGTVMERSAAVVLAVALDKVYAHFARLHESQQALLLKFYFYRAIALGVPVRAYLQTALNTAPGVIQYINEDKDLVGMIAANEEEVSLNSAKPVGKFAKLAQEFLASAGKRGVSESEQRKFVAAKAGEPEAVFLREAIGILVHLKEATLVDWLHDHQHGPDEQYQIDLVQLVFSFGFHGEFIFIMDYFKNKNPVVPIKAFLNKLREVVPLENEDSVQALARLTGLFHQARIIPSSQELIEFHEQDGKFHWNEKLVV